MKKILISAVISAAMATTVFASASDGLSETSPAKVTGYYHSDENDVIMFANGTAYSMEDTGSNLLEGPFDFTVYSNGDDFLLGTEDSYAYFHEQSEKGKTDNGGIYYAVYMDYLGMEEEIGYKEGKQTNFSGYIFENDYEVYERDSLVDFFGVDITGGSNGKMEGEGFDTPEEAMEAYIRAFAANDIDGMIAAFAVETYAENYNVIRSLFF